MATGGSQEVDEEQIAEEEVNKYLALPQGSMSVNVLEWWKLHEKEFPRVARMARQSLSVPATSACCERFFSAAGLAFEDLRQAMSEGHLEHLMWAKFNVVKLQCRDV